MTRIIKLKNGWTIKYGAELDGTLTGAFLWALAAPAFLMSYVCYPLAYLLHIICGLKWLARLLPIVELMCAAVYYICLVLTGLSLMFLGLLGIYY